MSTRGLYGFHKNGIDKLTYNHLDSYPDWLGKKVVEFCKCAGRDGMNSLFDHIELVSEDAEADDARVEVVDQYVVIRETHEFPIVGEWTRDRRKFLKCEIRIHVPAGSIAQGEYDIT